MSLSLLLLPVLLLLPGLGWARRLSNEPLQVFVDASWLSVVAMVPGVVLVKLVGGGLWTLLAWAAVVGLPGLVVGWGRPLSARSGAWVALLSTLMAVGGWGLFEADRLQRPLETWWYHAGTEQLPGEAVGWSAEGERRVGWPEAGAGVVEPVPETLRMDGEGSVLLLCEGPVGATLFDAEVQTDPTEVEEEGPVPRYLERGVTGVLVDAEPELRIQHSGCESLWVLPSQDAPWSVHASGELQFVHYYQILNIVENQRWSLELLQDRWLTVNQPPLWSYVLATSTVLAGGDLPGANALMLWVLVLLALSGARLLELVAPRAPMVAWALPAIFAVVHGKLMLEPGSTNFPDSLYACAFVGGLAALRQEGAWRFALLGLLAGLLRYPGTIALSLAALLAAGIYGKGLRPLALLWATVLAAAAAIGLGGLLSGQFDHWLEVLWFETIPEHYNNNGEAPPIWQRPPEFYVLWLRYTGWGLLFALPLAGRGARWVLGCAAAYSLFLCTIDHFPSHYFLPLVALSAVAIGANAGALRGAWRHLLPALGLVAGLVFLWRGHL